MISAAEVRSFWVLRIRPAGFAGVSSGSPFTSGITATPVSKPESPSASRGKTSRATATIMIGLPCWVKSASRQLPSTLRIGQDVLQTDGHDDGIQREVGDHEGHGNADRLLEAFQKDSAQDGDEEERDRYLMPFQDRGQERILQHVRGGIGGGEGDRDDEVGGDEAEEDQHEELALPPGEQALQHGDRAFATRAFTGDPPVDG